MLLLVQFQVVYQKQKMFQVKLLIQQTMMLYDLVSIWYFHRLFEQFLVIIFSQVTDFRKNAQFLYFVPIFIK